MKQDTAKKVLQVRMPGFRMASTGIKTDSTSSRADVDQSSPPLKALKERFFSGSIVAASVKPPSADSGILIVEKESKKSGGKKESRAIIVNKGRIVGRQG